MRKKFIKYDIICAGNLLNMILYRRADSVNTTNWPIIALLLKISNIISNNCWSDKHTCFSLNISKCDVLINIEFIPTNCVFKKKSLIQCTKNVRVLFILKFIKVDFFFRKVTLSIPDCICSFILLLLLSVFARCNILTSSNDVLNYVKLNNKLYTKCHWHAIPYDSWRGRRFARR